MYTAPAGLPYCAPVSVSSGFLHRSFNLKTRFKERFDACFFSLSLRYGSELFLRPGIFRQNISL